MIFETVESEGLAHFSYVLGDEGAGVGVVIDPRRDVDVYLDIVQPHSIEIAGILETHVHADFVSGSCELAARTGAPIYAGAEGAYGFEHRPLADGDRVAVGTFRLEALHTPGHTPEHVCYLVSGGTGAEAPWGLFSGDTLFAGEVGRPDLLGEDNEERLLLVLPDESRLDEMVRHLLRIGYDNVGGYLRQGQRHGFSQVYNLPGSMDAWRSADYPLESP